MERLVSCFRHFLFVLLFINFPGLALGADIQWKVVHPFRFFTEQSDFQMHIDAYDEVPKPDRDRQDTIMAMEHKLNDVEWLKGWIAKHKDVVGTYEFSKGKKLYSEYKDAAGQLVRLQPEKGWASLIEARASTCWDEDKQSHLSCHVDDFAGEPRTRNMYVRPIAHTVSLSLKDAPAGNCKWSSLAQLDGFTTKSKLEIFIDGKQLKAGIEADCRSEVLARIPFDPDLEESQRGVPVKVTLRDGSELKPVRIWIKDRLVVGFGDSYSSGEGNPDTPVTLEAYPSPKSMKAFGAGIIFENQPNAKGEFGRDPEIATFKAYPVAAEDSRAQWLDRNCHRSAYSYHLRTALQLAIEDYKSSSGHSSLTFLGYACSGAEITEGILGSYGGKERNAGITERYSAYQKLSQINRLNLDLCLDKLSFRKGRGVDGLTNVARSIGREIRGNDRPLIFDCKKYARKIDLLIISVGGNDVGFAPLIAYVIIGNKGEFPGYANFTHDFKNKVLALLANLFGVRHDIKTAKKKLKFLFGNYYVLNREVAELPLKKLANGKIPIVLTGFPNFATDETGINCGSESDPARIVAARLDGMSTTGILSVGPGKLNEAVKFALESLLPKMRKSATDLGWTFVDAHIPKFNRHGFCAKMVNHEQKFENLKLPFYAVAKGTKTQGWFSESPSKILPYAKRQRWIRTFHDECLMGQFQKDGGSVSSKSILSDIDYLEACLGGPMHPTAEGHAAYADATAFAAKKLLGINQVAITQTPSPHSPPSPPPPQTRSPPPHAAPTPAQRSSPRGCLSRLSRECGWRASRALGGWAILSARRSGPRRYRVSP